MCEFIYPVEYDKKRHAFLFNAELMSPLVLMIKALRSEAEYDNDAIPEKTALNFIHSLNKRFVGNIYSVISGQQIVKANTFHARKSLLPSQSGLRKLGQRKIETSLQNGLTRQGLVVSLAGFDFDVKDKLVLNFVSGLFVLSKQDIDTTCSVVSDWLADEIDSSFSFSYHAIARDLAKYKDTALMRYFPADNGRHEMLVFVGNEHFVSASILPLLDLIDFRRESSPN